jgi:glutamate decarboxylase
MESLRDLAVHASTRIAGMGPFELICDGTAIPVFAFALKDGAPYTVFDVSERLRIGGWQVPAYTMPDDATDIAVMRVVVREGFSYDLADDLVDALTGATDYLAKNPPREAAKPGFSHT